MASEALWLDLEDLEEGDLPCIARTDDDRFVALLDATDRGVALFDPETGAETVSVNQLAARWGGAILTVDDRDHARTQRRLDAVAADPVRLRQHALVAARGADRVSATLMSEVYRADGGARCLKMLPFYVAEESSVARSFRGELEILRRLRSVAHPNVAAVAEIAEAERCYAMDWFDGDPIAAFELPLESGRVMAIARQVAAALRVLHGQGIVHRDVSPNNVLVGAGDRALLIDFGLAFSFDRGQPPGPRAGTLAFRAPEQWRGETIGPATDVFCLGLLVHDLATGRHPLRDVLEPGGTIPTAATTWFASTSASPSWPRRSTWLRGASPSIPSDAPR